MTKKARATENIRYWKRSEMHELYHAYTSASPKKWCAWEHCKDLCRAYNGHNLKVISKNTFIFTAGFEFVNEETGVVNFMYITPNYHIAVEM